RHTRWPRDWSSDVCSSDLGSVRREVKRERGSRRVRGARSDDEQGLHGVSLRSGWQQLTITRKTEVARALLPLGEAAVRRGHEVRSEERRVGKEWRVQGGGY